eukprot:747043-Hanusia_phi.AAC.1
MAVFKSESKPPLPRGPRRPTLSGTQMKTRNSMRARPEPVTVKAQRLGKIKAWENLLPKLLSLCLAGASRSLEGGVACSGSSVVSILGPAAGRNTTVRYGTVTVCYQGSPVESQRAAMTRVRGSIHIHINTDRMF